MTDQILRLPAQLVSTPVQHRPAASDTLSVPSVRPRRQLGEHLVAAGAVTPAQLARALRMQLRLRAPVGEILVAQGWARPEDVLAALSRQYGLPVADLSAGPPDPALVALKPPAFWLEHRAMPIARLDRTIMIATARPDRFAQLREALSDTAVPVLAALAEDGAIDAAVANGCAARMIDRAESRVPAAQSWRRWKPLRRLSLAAFILAGLVCALAAPIWATAILSLAAVLALTLYSGLKLLGVAAHFLVARPRANRSKAQPGSVLPKVSLIVPLYRETEIAGTLVERLKRLTYPRPLLDVILAVEEADQPTRRALAGAELPGWMRVVEVPARGRLRTKPRAMNYALDFCRGDIVGVWDAEDAPAPDQIEQVVEHFAAAPAQVACLQGVLDYYNTRSGWLTRCFTIEYAGWFRIVLDGIARLGLVVPLGGTTLFVRRDVLESLGGWDAHNVTEDADLGVRLARAGYRTEMIATVTAEEATSRFWPWVRQRSRWLKGFMATYLVHMRDPRRLRRDLGAGRFWGFQAFFVGTVGQFLLAPVLWSFWLLLLGFGHPATALAPGWAVLAGAGLLIGSELLGAAIGAAAVAKTGRWFLLPFVITMPVYFALGTIAALKALAELLLMPFFWDKTRHGQTGPDTAGHVGAPAGDADRAGRA